MRRTGEKMKNNLQSLNLENLKNIVVGSTFLAAAAADRAKKAMRVELMKEEGGSGLEIPLVQVSQMETKKTDAKVVSTMVARFDGPRSGNLCG